MPSIVGIMAEGDTAYCSKANEDFIEKVGLCPKIYRKMLHFNAPRHIQRSNAEKSVLQYPVEHVFADQKSQTGLSIQIIGITRVIRTIGLANIVANVRRCCFLQPIKASA